MRLALCLWVGLAALVAAAPGTPVAAAPDTAPTSSVPCKASTINNGTNFGLTVDQKCHRLYLEKFDWIWVEPECSCEQYITKNCKEKDVDYDPDTFNSYKCYPRPVPAGTVVFYPKLYLTGLLDHRNAMLNCANFAIPGPQSLKQYKGARCVYFEGENCTDSMAISTYESRHENLIINELSPKEADIKSVSCAPLE